MYRWRATAFQALSEQEAEPGSMPLPYKNSPAVQPRACGNAGGATSQVGLAPAQATGRKGQQADFRVVDDSDFSKLALHCTNIFIGSWQSDTVIGNIPKDLEVLDCVWNWSGIDHIDTIQRLIHVTTRHLTQEQAATRPAVLASSLCAALPLLDLVNGAETTKHSSSPQKTNVSHR